PASFVDMAMGNLARTLIIAALLVLILLFLYQWRLALIGLLTIPLSLIAAGGVLYLRGYTLNAMTLAGLTLAVGLIFDDVIGDLELVFRRLRQDPRQDGNRITTGTPAEVVLGMRGLLIYATLIVLLAVAPLFLLTGVTGDFFQPLAVSFVVALLASMVVALTVTPVLCLLLLSRAPVERRASPLLLELQRLYTTA